MSNKQHSKKSDPPLMETVTVTTEFIEAVEDLYLYFDRHPEHLHERVDNLLNSWAYLKDKEGVHYEQEVQDFIMLSNSLHKMIR